MNHLHYDLCVIGGGINGAGIARDAAGRGLSVLLVEADDLAGATSSASSKLIHGGLRYLEYYEFMMVREALKEREALLNIAPHLIHPIECVLPQDEDSGRPAWMLRLGLWLYDRLGGKKTVPNSRILDFANDPLGTPLKTGIVDGFVYSDGWVDDTRLVVLNAVDAAERGAKILTRTKCEGLSVQDGRWLVSLRDMRGGDTLDISAAMVVNATGPWVDKLLKEVGVDHGDPDLPNVRLVKGSHIIVPRQYEGGHCYVLQQSDKRIVFVSPYESEYTLIGTTEEVYGGDPREAMASEGEISYLCAAYNRYFSKEVSQQDIIFTYSGVRPLFDDGSANASAVTRDYKIYHHERYEAPFLSVYGGKLTTYRALSENVVNKLMRLSGRAAEGWTSNEALTGGDFGEHDRESYIYAQRKSYPWLPLDILSRYVRAYGTRMDYFLYGKNDLTELGTHYGDGLYKSEIEYLINYEFADCVEDIIWRRSKMGLCVSEQSVQKIRKDFFLN